MIYALFAGIELQFRFKSIRLRSGGTLKFCIRFQVIDNHNCDYIEESYMRKIISAAVVACFAAVSFTAPAMADSLVIKVKPRVPVVKKVVVKPACYTKTVKRVYNHKVVITKKRVCP
jgi:hypothetical protein